MLESDFFAFAEFPDIVSIEADAGDSVDSGSSSVISTPFISPDMLMTSPYTPDESPIFADSPFPETAWQPLFNEAPPETGSHGGQIVAVDGSVVGISERKRKRVSSTSYTPRPRAEPLPPIVVDDAEDTVAVKRARNTLAARRSRERKMLKLTDLEVKVDGLVSERDAALKRVKELEKELERLKSVM